MVGNEPKVEKLTLLSEARPILHYAPEALLPRNRSERHPLGNFRKKISHFDGIHFS